MQELTRIQKISKYKPICDKLSEEGFNIVWLMDINLLFEISHFVPCNPSNNIHDIELQGRDISVYLDNFESNFHKNKIITKLETLPVKTYKLSPLLSEWIWFVK